MRIAYFNAFQSVCLWLAGGKDSLVSHICVCDRHRSVHSCLDHKLDEEMHLDLVKGWRNGRFKIRGEGQSLVGEATLAIWISRGRQQDFKGKGQNKSPSPPKCNPACANV